MAWSEERVELLKKLWADGLSCSQIAGRLPGTTRNSIIGKVYRLGLSGRVTMVRTKHPPRRTYSARSRKSKSVGHPWNPVQKLLGEPFVPQSEPIIPPHERQPILVRKDDGLHANDALTETSCRWPCGDVGDADFGFCGREKVPGLSYCADHARIAFNATNPNPRPRKLRVIVNRAPEKVPA